MHSILHGDCLALLPTLPANSIDAIVTDPPYCLTNTRMNTVFCEACGAQGLSFDSAREPCHKCGGKRTTAHKRKGFMNQAWDNDVAFHPDVWRECLRVLKPGGYMVAFGGCRTYHRLATAIEDAGFILHPMLAWAFGSGFPKATNASKMIDKHLGAEREVISERQAYGIGGKGCFSGHAEGATAKVTATATPQATEWEGWAYGLQSLKPALEPICMAQKPMIGTGAQNILAWGVGAVNIDASRVPTDDVWATKAHETHGSILTHATAENATSRADSMMRFKTDQQSHPTGRWPSNLLLDGSDEVAECFPQSKVSGSAKNGTRSDKLGSGDGVTYLPIKPQGPLHNDEGSAARFFPALGYTDDERRILYCPKAGKLDRAGSSHPTVKPIKLIEWLCTLICPPNGTILDPFAGSGTTGQAAINLGFDVIMIERETEYYNDILKRVAWPPLPADAP